MDQEFVGKIKKILEERKKAIESRFSEGGEKTAGDGYATRFPDYGDDDESAVSEVEDYGTNVGIDNDLYKNLRAIKAALERIKGGRYGQCVRCGRIIAKKRLEAYPAASLCLDCEKK